MLQLSSSDRIYYLYVTSGAFGDAARLQYLYYVGEPMYKSAA